MKHILVLVKLGFATQTCISKSSRSEEQIAGRKRKFEIPINGKSVRPGPMDKVESGFFSP